MFYFVSVRRCTCCITGCWRRSHCNCPGHDVCSDRSRAGIGKCLFETRYMTLPGVSRMTYYSKLRSPCVDRGLCAQTWSCVVHWPECILVHYLVIFLSSDLVICLCTDMVIFWCTHLNAFWCTDLVIFLCTDLVICLCADLNELVFTYLVVLLRVAVVVLFLFVH
jgi:hypothetical protein